MPQIKKSVSDQKELTLPKQQTLESAEKIGPPAPLSEQSKSTAKSRKRSQKQVLGGLSINAPVFNPMFGGAEPVQNQNESDQENEAADENQAYFGGYKNRHLNADLIAETKIKT